ncbi:HAT dimerization, partial [Gloeophyllum trabeum ATCC 11539]
EELEQYLSSPLEQVEDVVRWWGHHTAQYPVLSRMVRDYLAIQGSAVASERAFSSGNMMGTKLRNRLTPVIYEALQILKSAYRNGYLSASEEV